MNEPKTRKEREVWHACQSLWEEGTTAEQMTGVVIGNKLEALGHRRGSNTDIHRYKKSWIEAVGLNQVTLQQFTHKAQLSSPIATAVSRVERELRKELEAEEAKIRDEAQAEVYLLNVQLEKTVTELSRARDKLQEMTECQQLLEKEKQTIHLEFEKVRDDLVRISALYEDLVVKDMEYRDEAKKQYTSLKKEHSDEITAYQRRIDGLIKTHREEMKGQAQLLYDERKVNSEKYDKQNNVINNVNREVGQLSQKIKSLQHDNKDLAKEIKSLEHKVQRLHASGEKLNKENHTLQNDLAFNKGRVETLDKMLENRNHECEKIHDKYNKNNIRKG